MALSSVNKTIVETKKSLATAPTTNTTAAIKTAPDKTDNKTAKPVVSGPVSKTTTKQEQPVVKIQTVPAKQPDAVIAKTETKPVEVKTEPVAALEKPVARKTDAEITKSSAVIEGRKSEFSHIVNFKSDRLELSLYDNGEIDGDTVSVFMIGEVLMAKQGLKSKAIKKTIYITRTMKSFRWCSLPTI